MENKMSAIMSFRTGKFCKFGMLASSPLLAISPQVHASSGAEGKDAAKKLYKVSELPIYGNPDDGVEYEIVEKPYGALEKSISSVRKSLSKSFSGLEVTADRIKAFYETGVAHSKNSYEYITNEANTVPRAATITLGGLFGLLLGARGGIIKKVFYSSTGLLVTASICYPKQAADISKTAYERLRTQGFAAIKDLSGYDPNDLINPIEEKVKQIRLPAIVKDLFVKPDPVPSTTDADKDYGQSNPEDIDMYTTRNSLNQTF